MEITKDISDRIQILRFPLIVAIVFIHAGPIFFSAYHQPAQKYSFSVSFFIYLISEIFARVAVPLFFIISGFLFFKDFDLSFTTYLYKIKTRIKTLFVPYLFWNISLLILLLILQSVPFLSPYFSGRTKSIISYDLITFLDAMFAVHSLTPIAYQFWFIRDLMIMVLMAPVIYLVAKYAPLMGLIVFTLLWFLNLDIRFLIVRYEAILFFYIGGLLIITNWSLAWTDRLGPINILVYIITALGLATVQASEIISGSSVKIILLILIFIGIIVYWQLAGLLSKTNTCKPIMRLSAFGFFVFAIHEPILTFIKKLLFILIVPESSISVLAAFLILTTTTILISLICAILLKKYVNNFYNIITGAR